MPAPDAASPSRTATPGRLASPDRLDMGAQLVRPAAVLLLLAALLLVAACLTGSLLIHVPIKIRGEGILMTVAGFQDAVAEHGGRLRTVRVQAGQHVSAGQIVAEIDQADLLQEITQAQADLDETGQDLTIPERRLHHAAAQRQLTLLTDRLRRHSVLLSPYAGIVTELKLNEGEIIERGSALFSLLPDAPPGTALIATIYVSAVDSNNIRPGMRVELVPGMVKREDYGFILGRVVSVAPLPSTSEGMQHTLKNQKLVQAWSAAGAPVQVQVALEAAPANASGVRWSSSAGPDTRLNPGSLCAAAVVIREETIFRLLVPAARRLLPGFSS